MEEQTIENILINAAQNLIFKDLQASKHENNLRKVYGEDFMDPTRIDNCEVVLDLLLVPPDENKEDSRRDTLIDLYIDFVCRENEEIDQITEENVHELILSIIEITETIYDFHNFPSKERFKEIYTKLNLKH